MKNLCSRLYRGRGGRDAPCAGSMAVEMLERGSVGLPDSSEAFIVLAMQEYSSFPRDATDMLTLATCKLLPLEWLPFQLLETVTPEKALDSSKRARPALQGRVS
jgi:hypothetical protein